jgi:hypothetical protein
MMIRNAVRIIALNIFKLNDERVNNLLFELPFCSYFLNLACLFRDKLVDLEKTLNGDSGKTQIEGQ